MKNCENCKHMKLILTINMTRFWCDGQDYFKSARPHLREQKHLEQMQDTKYRSKSKICFKKKK